jgi:hypothetical protein
MKDTPIDGEAIRLTKQTLTSEWAALANQAGKSNEFDEVEIDILFHVHSPHVDKPTVGPELSMIALNPKQDRIALKAPVFLKNISDEALPIGDPIPNRYIAVEVTLDFKMILEKLVQLERILTLLLERKKFHRSSKEKMGDLLVSDIIQFAGIACPGNRHVQNHGRKQNLVRLARNLIIKHKRAFPMIAQMCYWKRFFVYCCKADTTNFLPDQVMELKSVVSSTEFLNAMQNSINHKNAYIAYVHGNNQSCEVGFENKSWESFKKQCRSCLKMAKPVEKILEFIDGVWISVKDIELLRGQHHYLVLAESDKPPDVPPDCFRLSTLRSTSGFESMDAFYMKLKLEFDENMRETSLKAVQSIFASQSIGTKQLICLTDEKLEKIGLNLGLREANLAVLRQ